VEQVDPEAPVVRARAQVHVLVLARVDPEARVDSPEAAVVDPEARVVRVAPVVRGAREVRVAPVVRGARVVREDAVASGVVPVAAATPPVRSVSPVVAPRAGVSPSAPSAKSSTTWRPRPSVASGCLVVVGRPCGCRVEPR
jgi:hypothetical protein